MVKTKLSQVIPPLLDKLFLDKNFIIKAIYLFGSYASGTENDHSDIDIAVLLHNKLSPLMRWEIQSELANQLNCEVDLVDLLNASTVMQNEIIQQGVCIYDPNNVAALFEMQVMSMYQHLNEERADILMAYIGKHS